ncbi:hypothetical protein [Thiolapillus sp.]
MNRLIPPIASLLLGACTTAPLQTPSLPLVVEPSINPSCANLLDDYETFSLMDGRGRKQMLDDVSSAWLLTRNNCEQLRLALLLSQPDRPDNDRRKALKLVKELLRNEKLLDAQAHQLARLLHDQLRQAHLQQRKVVELKQRLQAQHSASKQLAEQLNNLQSQLQQLKNIEQNINEKEQSIITPSTGNLSDEPP